MSEKNEKRNTVLKDIEGRPIVFGRSDVLEYTPYVGAAKEVLDAAIARGDMYYIDPNNKTWPEQSTNRQNIKGWNEKMAEKRNAYEDDLYNTYKRGISKASGNVIFGAEAQSPTLPESVAYLDGTMPRQQQRSVAQIAADEIDAKEETPAAVATEAASQKEETPAAPDTQASDDVIDLEGVDILRKRSQKKAPETTFPKNVSPFDSAGTRIPNESARNAGVSKLDDYYHRSVLETLPETPAAVATEAASQKEETPAAQTAVEDGGKMTILWPERPKMEKGNYVEQTDAQIAQAQKYAAEQERRAKRDRDMAILSDIANLATKGAAMHGGAWKIDKEEARSAVANEKLRALRESNSKLLAEYARRRMEAADAARKERNAEKKAEYDAAVDKAKWEADEDYRNARLKEEESYHNALLGIQGAREERLKNQGGGNGSGNKEKMIRYINGMAFDYNDDKAVVYAYSKMVQADPGKIITEEFVTSRGKKVEKAVSNPSVNQMRRALVNGGMTATPPKKNAVSGANKGKTAGFSSGKKAGFK